MGLVITTCYNASQLLNFCMRAWAVRHYTKRKQTKQKTKKRVVHVQNVKNTGLSLSPSIQPKLWEIAVLRVVTLFFMHVLNL